MTRAVRRLLQDMLAGDRLLRTLRGAYVLAASGRHVRYETVYRAKAMGLVAEVKPAGPGVPSGRHLLTDQGRAALEARP